MASVSAGTESVEPSRLTILRDGTELSVLDHGGPGQPLVLLHGLAGHGGEWADTAAALGPKMRVIAPDARGHGRSERHPDDVRPEAFADDVAHLIEHLGAGPAILVGHSLGGQTALLTAARRPAHVRGLVIAEAGPAPITADEIEDVEAFLSAWPVPFKSRGAAEKFFGGPSLRATRWTDGLENRDDGLRPRFEVATMVEAMKAAEDRDWWDAWDAVSCRTLVVRGSNGTLSDDELGRMRQTRPEIEVEDIPAAGHDVHLEAVERWCGALARFVQ